MAEQTHVQPQRTERTDTPPSDVAQTQHAREARDQVEITDALLDDIDALIAEVGEDIGVNFRQKGGE